MFGHKTYKYAGEIEHIGTDGTRVVHGIKKCCHCGNHWVSQPGSGNRRGFCRNCMGDLCSDHCAQQCTPYDKQIEAIREAIIRGQHGIQS